MFIGEPRSYAAYFVALLASGCSANDRASTADAAVTDTGVLGATPLPDAFISTSADAASDASSSWAIIPGVSVGPITLGDTYASVRALLGAGTAIGMAHLNFVNWNDLGLQIFFASSTDADLSDDAIALAIGVNQAAGFAGAALPGASLSALTAALGPATDTAGAIAYWASGVSANIDPSSSAATQVAVYAPYFPETVVPEMQPSNGPGLSPKVPDAGAISVIDMHLHPGFLGRIPEATKAFLIGNIPSFTQLYAPAAMSNAITPYAPFVGIKAETEYSGADHAVLFAVYTQKTTGWFSNEELESVLTDPRNVAPDGLPWAWGLASIDFFDGFIDADGGVDQAISTARYAALGSYFAKRRDLFIGIKLAHAHQGIAFDDPRYLGVYDVAAQYNVPVYLHTGFTPFPAAVELPAYYDPEGLENTIINLPKVKFILGHVGQGDERATDHALALAKKYANVYLEVSALNLPLLIEADGGAEPDGGEPVQYGYVLSQIQSQGLISKTLFGTDGPQYDGMGKGYVASIEGAMATAGYSDTDVRNVMSGNFIRVYFDAGM